MSTNPPHYAIWFDLPWIYFVLFLNLNNNMEKETEDWASTSFWWPRATNYRLDACVRRVNEVRARVTCLLCLISRSPVWKHTSTTNLSILSYMLAEGGLTLVELRRILDIRHDRGSFFWKILDLFVNVMLQCVSDNSCVLTAVIVNSSQWLYVFMINVQICNGACKGDCEFDIVQFCSNLAEGVDPRKVVRACLPRV